MMKSRKWLSVLLSAAMAGALMTGCGSSSASTSSAGSSAASSSTSGTASSSASATESASAEASSEAASSSASSDTETVAAVSSTSSGSAKGALKGVKLSFATTALFAPFTYYDTDGTTVIGFDIDFEKALQDYLGFEIDGDTQVMDYSAIATSLAQGQVDFGMAALCATDERKEVMNFSNTYCDSGQVVMINKETSPSEITDIDTLVSGDYTIAVEKGTCSHMYCTNNGVPADRLQVHDTITTAYESLEQGKVDAVIQDGPNANYYVENTPDTKLEVVGDEFNQGQAPYAIAISKEACERVPGLQENFNKAIQALIDDGTFDELKAKWLD